MQLLTLSKLPRKTLVVFFLGLWASVSSFAHFGSKGPFGGGVSTAIVHDSILYLGTFSGGVYQSTNSKLVAWTPRPVGLKSGKIAALVHTGKYLLAGTADSGVFLYNGFVGSDRYWIKKNNGLGNLKITSLIALDTATVLAGTNGGGIFKTTDKGTTWVAIDHSVLEHLEITAMVKAGNRIIYASINGLFASDDKGTSSFDFNDAQTNNKIVHALSYNAGTDELLVATDNGLYLADSISTDLTPNFSLAETGLPTGTVASFVTNNGTNWYVINNQGLHVSNVTNLQWVKAATGTINDVNVVVPYRNSLVAGTLNNGVWKSTLLPGVWTAIATGFNNLKTYAMATSGDLLVIAATEKGVFVSRDLAASYAPSNKGLEDSLNVTSLAFGETYLVAATKNKGVFLSSDSGKTWITANNNLLNMNVKKVYVFHAVKYAICSNNIVYASPLTSSDWTSIQNGLVATGGVNALMQYGNKLWLATSSGIFTNTVGGNGWKEANDGLSNLNVTSLTASKGKVYAGTWGSGVFVTDSGTVNWDATAQTAIDHTSLVGLNGNYIQALASLRSYVFASYKGGLLATSDSGATWIAGGNQFNLPSYTDVNEISFVTTRVFVTTQYNGLYSNALSELPVVAGLNEELWGATDASGLTVSPNPNNGTFSVSSLWAIKEMGIYSAEGHLLMEATNGQTFRSGSLRSGIYLLKAKTDVGTAMQKFVVQ